MRINREIRADRLRVVAEDGRQLGVMSFREALAMAEDQGLDLVEIAPTAKPPVAKIIDYGKLRYHQTKKEKESRKSQVVIRVKEVKLKPNIDTHDFETKVKHAREFVLKGCKVRISIMFRGREMLHIDLGQKVVQQFCDELSDIASVEAPPKLMGRTMTTVLTPSGKRPKQSNDKKIGESTRA
ncbi:MAG: translation initiation factor IF-3 [Chlamydiae bacterium RIFCSPHIGHO2_12_FULL_44_59]|nr:MAG: translation initiation factor IF-3 [Chlamydiae bacterium RIFCSPHIGHO2_01_FULL_44_39]OGN57669.1 MAG: translation initiation factor IF-3 [Chlamydiae bacterium RIFCSPHIGHO2_02_FULL_45_9]OGN60217.1 MAG: translation initiation factor IF-3 [Chlamydiae bacterium RIFCSPHIGHO2_12_FULL_44_59]OGN67130.1 MAG: translation initiation factor IF-3 [Chlamydiae bacterium RIFCSPLOWO2_01_FULL_44_52]OGN67720.1 MAG: translation initiation factor IF-3 [Chlamydiae bacterium RIFCSPLOWO2_02_FULL_45_22]OGN71423.